MARLQTLVLLIGATAALAACAQREEEVYIQPEPIAAEPAPTGKY